MREHNDDVHTSAGQHLLSPSLLVNDDLSSGATSSSQSINTSSPAQKREKKRNVEPFQDLKMMMSKTKTKRMMDRQRMATAIMAKTAAELDRFQ